MIDEPNGSKTHKYSELPRIKSERSMPVRMLISVIKDAQKEWDLRYLIICDVFTPKREAPTMHPMSKGPKS